MTEFEICNWALLKLGQYPLRSMEEKSITSEYCKLLISPMHRGLLRSYAWTFATRSALLSPLNSDHRGRVCYGLPKKCLKVLKIDREGELRGDRIFSEEADFPELSIQYIEDISLEDCDPLYCEAVACRLAGELCQVLTADSSLTLRIKSDFERAKATAIDMDGIEIIASAGDNTYA